MTSLDSSNFEKLDLIRFSLILAIRGEFLKVAKFRRLAQNAAPGVPDLRVNEAKSIFVFQYPNIPKNIQRFPTFRRRARSGF